MSNFFISKPGLFVNSSSENVYTFPETIVNYNSQGFLSNGQIFDTTYYNIVSQTVIKPITFKGINVKYGCLSGNCYIGGNTNSFVITLYKNNQPTNLTLTISNSLSKDGPIIANILGAVDISTTDTWALYIQPNIPGEAPTSGNNIWCINLVY